MLNANQIHELKEQLTLSKNEEALALLLTVEQLQNEAAQYRETVLRKLTTIETDMGRLLDENERLIQVREAAFVERDSCIGLLAKIAQKAGLSVGVANSTTLALDLPSGQVAWQFEEAEAHLLECLPVYSKPIEDLEIIEKYTRIMNPGL